MATTPKLSVKKRTPDGKGAARKARAAGRVPAVVYGHGEETRSVEIDKHELELLFSRVHYENTLIELDIEGEKAGVKVLVREVQKHPFRSDVLHVDFYQIHAGEKVTVEVPVRLVGTAPGVKAGGILMHVMSDVEVRCLPDHIPDHFDVDVSGLEIGDAIHVSELPLPEGVEPQVDGDRVVVTMSAPIVSAVVEGEAPEAAEAAPAEPEVIRRGKEEEGE